MKFLVEGLHRSGYWMTLGKVECENFNEALDNVVEKCVRYDIARFVDSSISWRPADFSAFRATENVTKKDFDV